MDAVVLARGRARKPAGVRITDGANPVSGRVARVPLTVVMALIRSSVVAGADVRSAMENVGLALEGLHADAAALVVIARRLGLGMAWADAWADCPATWTTLERALRSAWRTGSSPVGAIDVAIAASHARARAAGDRSAAELGVRLTLPLTLCFLPAFVLVGIVPLLLTVASGVVGAA